jgi:hypothetical protein
VNVLPNIDDKPTQRYIELWLATDATDPGTNAHFKVFHPDGSYKGQVDATNYTSGNSSSRCAGPVGMFNAAKNTGQIGASTISNTTPGHDSLQDWCIQQAKDFYYGSFGLSKHQPYGDYRIEATVSKPANGGTSVLVYWIHVDDVSFLAKDFNALEFGQIQAGQLKNISGDVNWSPPGDNSAPTLQNQGNAGFTIEMAYLDLCLQVPSTGGLQRDCGPSKQILEYDGGLGTSIATVEHRPAYPETTVAHVANEADLLSVTHTGFLNPTDSGTSPRFRTLCPNDLAKVDFSLHSPNNLQAGTFAGKVDLKVVRNPICPTDLTHVYGPSSQIGTSPVLYNIPFNTYNGQVQVQLEAPWNGVTPKDTAYWP